MEKDSMTTRLRSARRISLAFGAACLLAVAGSGNAAHGEDKVLATVDGLNVTEKMLEIAERDIQSELGGLSPEQRRGSAFQYVVHVLLMAKAAKDANLENSAAFATNMDYFRQRALRDTFFQAKVMDAVTDQDARRIYEERIKELPEDGEVRARHVLLETKEDAEDVLERLGRGDEFEDLAREFSKGPTGPNGGDLGYFGRGSMVKEFEDAAFALKVGQVSEPVQSSFGWHVIRLEDRRKAPPYEEVAEQIKAELIYYKTQEVVDGLEKSAKIEIVDESIKEAVKEAARGSFSQ